VSSRLSWRRSTERCGCSVPRWQGRPPRAANVRGSWANRSVTASTTSITRTHLHERAKSSLPQRRCCGLSRHPRPLRRETCTARCRLSSSKRPSSRPRAQHHASANRGMRGTTEPHRGANPRSTQEERRGDPPTQGARRSRSGSLTRAGRWTATPATSPTPGARARRTHGQRWATTLNGVDATTATKTAL
jgi:hypothetical protein